MTFSEHDIRAASDRLNGDTNLSDCIDREIERVFRRRKIEASALFGSLIEVIIAHIVNEPDIEARSLLRESISRRLRDDLEKANLVC